MLEDSAAQVYEASAPLTWSCPQNSTDLLKVTTNSAASSSHDRQLSVGNVDPFRDHLDTGQKVNVPSSKRRYRFLGFSGSIGADAFSLRGTRSQALRNVSGVVDLATEDKAALGAAMLEESVNRIHR
jgi:hypothetical protein